MRVNAKEKRSEKKKKLAKAHRDAESGALTWYHKFLEIFSKYKKTFDCPLCGSRILKTGHSFTDDFFRDPRFCFKFSMCCSKCGVGFKDASFKLRDPQLVYASVREVFKKEVHLRRCINSYKKQPCKYCGGRLSITTTRSKDHPHLLGSGLSLRVRIACSQCGAFGETVSSSAVYVQIDDVHLAYMRYIEWYARFVASLRS